MKLLPDIRALKAFCTSCLLILVSLGLALPAAANSITASSVSFETASSGLAQHSCAFHQKATDHQMMMDCCDGNDSCSDDMTCAKSCVSSNVLTSFVLPSTGLEVFAAIAKSSLPQIKSTISWSIALDAPPPRG
ncbi:MAG: hypothetical protein COA47_10995 [Robiginitomaculum sp.]|nr:MAG: hypothetical protein COA47_10995 [Robiginitomaculum sp.]